jgi:hypothetical protein
LHARRFVIEPPSEAELKDSALKIQQEAETIVDGEQQLREELAKRGLPERGSLEQLALRLARANTGER